MERTCTWKFCRSLVAALAGLAPLFIPESAQAVIHRAPLMAFEVRSLNGPRHAPSVSS